LTFGIDKNDKPFYTVDLPSIKYDTKEQVKDPKTGKVLGSRYVTKEIAQEPLRKSPSEMGWLKQVEFETVVLLQVADMQEHGKIKPQLFYRKYIVDAETYYQYHKCDLCEHNGIGSRFHFLRAMPQGIFHICWLNATKFGRSASGTIQLHMNREGKPSAWCKLIEEKQIDKSEAMRILKRLQRLASVDVRLFLEYDSEKFSQ
jgi:hypothetical protein